MMSGDEEHQIFVSLDRTKAQNKKLYDLRAEKKRQAERGETDWVIRNYRLVKKDDIKTDFAEFFRGQSSSSEDDGEEEAQE